MTYDTDLKDIQWNSTKPHLDPDPEKAYLYNRRKYCRRMLVNAVFYVIKTGCQWRMLPKDFPDYRIVHKFYSSCCKKGIWQKIMDELVKIDRKNTGRSPGPHYAIIDSQSVKTNNSSEKVGIDGGKKIKGHKRHIVVDTAGRMLHVKVHEANLHDTTAGGEVVEETLKKYPAIEAICGDAGYRGKTKNFVTKILKKTMHICERISNGWHIIPWRWVVERTFGWFNNFRRLSKDYEKLVKSAENMIMISHVMLLLNRMSKKEGAVMN
jgi:putative transposase